MKKAKARIQGNAVVVTIPKSFGVKPGAEFRFTKEENGILKLTPTKQVPETMDELFKDWDGEYQMPSDLAEWNQENPTGEELW